MSWNLFAQHSCPEHSWAHTQKIRKNMVPIGFWWLWIIGIIGITTYLITSYLYIAYIRDIFWSDDDIPNHIPNKIPKKHITIIGTIGRHGPAGPAQASGVQGWPGRFSSSAGFAAMPCFCTRPWRGTWLTDLTDVECWVLLLFVCFRMSWLVSVGFQICYFLASFRTCLVEAEQYCNILEFRAFHWFPPLPPL